MTGDYQDFRRAGRFRYVAMPGGEAAIREPWRMALSHLLDAGLSASVLGQRVASAQLATVEKMVAQKFNCPLTSSVGRLFDAVAALIGLRKVAGFEGQAAMELEWCAARNAVENYYPFEILKECGTDSGSDIMCVDTRHLISAVARDVVESLSQSLIARRFHSSLVEIIFRVCGRIREETGLNAVVLGGGVFLNMVLLTQTIERLRGAGFRVYWHRKVPSGDGGLCLGQLAVAARRLLERARGRSS